MALTAFFVSMMFSFVPAHRVLAQEDESAEAAEENTADDPLAQQAKQRRVENPSDDPLRVPTKDDWRNKRQRRDQQTLFAPPIPGQGDREQAIRMQMEKQLAELKRQHEQMLKEHTRMEEEFRRAMALKLAQGDELQKQLAQVETARAQMEKLRGSAPPLPKDAKTAVYSLRSSRAPEIAQVIIQVAGDRGLRMGVDERTNSLIISGGADTLETVEALIQQLDKVTEPPVDRRAKETLQLRIVWLLDIDEGMEPTEKLVSPQVVEALHELGFTDPRVVCQQVTTLTLSEAGGRFGQFNFEVPVLIKTQPWQLQGRGQIESMADERFSLRFDLGFRQLTNVPHQGVEQAPGEQAKLGGSIYTPLGHYTVIGTTTFVAAMPVEGFTTGGPPRLEPRQHLSAFVVYLDRAREFPAAGADSHHQNDERH